MSTTPKWTWPVAALLCSVAIALAALPAHATGVSPQIALAPASRLVLHGKSTLHDFASTATRLQIAVDLADSLPAGPPTLARLAEPGAVRSIVLTIPVEAMKSEKDGLDKNMYKALKAASNPNIVFRLLSPAVAKGDGGFHLTGDLEVAGVRQPVEMDVRASQTPDGIVLEGSKALLMSDYGIKPPKMFLGTLKTDDRIVVEWRLVLTHAGF
jgi:hypothetical protein